MSGVLPIEMHELILEHLARKMNDDTVRNELYRAILCYVSAVPELKESVLLKAVAPAAQYVRIDDIPRPFKTTKIFRRTTDLMANIDERLTEHQNSRTIRLTVLHGRDYGVAIMTREFSLLFTGNFTVDIDFQDLDKDTDEYLVLRFAYENEHSWIVDDIRAKVLVQSDQGSDMFIIDTAMDEIRLYYGPRNKAFIASRFLS